jgi:hypothetical protein
MQWPYQILSRPNTEDGDSRFLRNVSTYQIAWRHTADDSSVQSDRCDNPKPHFVDKGSNFKGLILPWVFNDVVSRAQMIGV